MGFLRHLRRKPALLAYLIVWVAFALRLWYWYTQLHAPLVIVGDEGNYYGGALKLVRGTADMLTSDDWLRYHNDWLEPPLYTLSLVGPIKLLGEGLPALRLLQVIVGVLTVALLFRLGWKLFDRWTGLLTALLATIYLPLVTLPVLMMTENLFLPLLLLAFVLLIDSRRGQTLSAFASGLTLGLATLARTVASFFFPIVAMWLLLQAHPNRKRGLAQFALFALGAVLAFGPWGVRNYALYQRALLTDTKGAEGLMMVDPGIESRLAHYSNPVDLQSAVIREYLNDWIAHPDVRLRDFVPQALHLLRPEALYHLAGEDVDYQASEFLRDLVLDDTVLFGVLLLGLLGLASAPEWKTTLLFLAWIVYNLLIQTVFYFSAVRYRMPVVIMLMPYAAFGLSILQPRLFAHPRPAQLGALGLGAIVLVAAMWSYPPRFSQLVAEGLALHDAQTAAQSNDVAAVVRAIGRAQEVNPASVAVQLAAGDIYRNMGQPVQALPWYRSAYQQVPDSCAARLRLGDLYRSTGDVELATKVLAPLWQDDSQFLDCAWDHPELVSGRPSILDVGELDAGFVRWMYGPGLIRTEGSSWRYRSTENFTQLRLFAPTGHARVLGLYLAGARPGDAPLPQVSVSVNGRPIAHFSAKQTWHVRNITLPKDLAGAGDFIVTLRIDPWPPSDDKDIYPPSYGIQLSRVQISDHALPQDYPFQ